MRERLEDRKNERKGERERERDVLAQDRAHGVHSMEERV